MKIVEKKCNLELNTFSQIIIQLYRIEQYKNYTLDAKIGNAQFFGCSKPSSIGTQQDHSVDMTHALELELTEVGIMIDHHP